MSDLPGMLGRLCWNMRAALRLTAKFNLKRATTRGQTESDKQTDSERQRLALSLHRTPLYASLPCHAPYVIPALPLLLPLFGNNLSTTRVFEFFTQRNNPYNNENKRKYQRKYEIFFKYFPISFPSLLSFAAAVALVARSIYTSTACNFNQVAFRATFCMANVECDGDKGILACRRSM